MPRHVATIVCVLVAAACHEPGPVGVLADGQRYVTDPDYRRQVLEDSLVNPANGYSQLRLSKYTESAWGQLPEWNPPVSPVTTSTTTGPSGAMRSLDIDAVPWEMDALVELGRAAFSSYPAQISNSLRRALPMPAAYGLWTTPESMNGLVWVQLTNLPSMPAMSCASCHGALSSAGAIVHGRPNATFNFGAIVSGSQGPDWGPGRVDVTPDMIDNPTAIADLRPVSSEQFLQHDGDVKNGIIELAIRIETLIITSNDESIRPPRKLAFALALYLWQLQPVAIRSADDSSKRGGQVFAGNCATCHLPPAYSGSRVPVATIGTDPSVGDSPDRTTGTYRVPSLRGVGDRGILFAAGQMSDLETLLDPARTIPGHRFGLDLSSDQRADLIAFLQTLE